MPNGGQKLLERVGRQGLWQAIWPPLWRRLGRRLPLEIHQVLLLEAADLNEPPAPPGDPFELDWLTPADVEHMACREELELAGPFAARLAQGHDQCLGAWNGGQLAAYCWLAFDSIEPGHSAGAGLSFPPDTAYMYKALTLGEFRGQRLYGRVVAAGLRRLAEVGIRRLVALVDWNNLDSLRACRQLGFQPRGKLVRLGRGPGSALWYPSAAERQGICFGPGADYSARLAPRPTHLCPGGEAELVQGPVAVV